MGSEASLGNLVGLYAVGQGKYLLANRMLGGVHS
jgi:hypothetical protein